MSGKGARDRERIELVLTHEAGLWRADWRDLTARAQELTGLERAVADMLRRRLGADCPRRVSMRFDRACLPAWLRQYQPHYFNYRLDLDPPPAPGGAPS